MADDDTVSATAQGLVQCLRMLAGEAASLNLLQTFAALEEALETCQSEMAGICHDNPFDLLRAGSLLH